MKCFFRKIMSVVIVMAMTVGIMPFVKVQASVGEIDVPSYWETLVSEDFENPDGIDASSEYPIQDTNYDTNESFNGNWFRTDTNITTNITQDGRVRLTLSSAGSSTGRGLSAPLQKPIDLTRDADYYIALDGTFGNFGNTNNLSLRLRHADNGIGSDNPFILAGVRYTSSVPYGPWLICGTDASITSFDNTNSESPRTPTAATNEMKTLVLHFSVRASGLSTCRMRLFDDDAE